MILIRNSKFWFSYLNTAAVSCCMCWCGLDWVYGDRQAIPSMGRCMACCMVWCMVCWFVVVVIMWEVPSLYRHYEDSLKAHFTYSYLAPRVFSLLSQGILFKSLFLLFVWGHNLKQAHFQVTNWRCHRALKYRFIKCQFKIYVWSFSVFYNFLNLVMWSGSDQDTCLTL